MNERHTISALVQDRPGVLQRVAGLFGKRGYNIESVTVGGAEKKGMARMTIVAKGDERTCAQIVLQLRKLIDVVEAYALAPGSYLSRELMLVKLTARPEDRPQMLALVDTFRCAVVDVGRDTITVQASGDAAKNDALLQLFEPFGVAELTRTGETAVARGRESDGRMTH